MSEAGGAIKVIEDLEPSLQYSCRYQPHALVSKRYGAIIGTSGTNVILFKCRDMLAHMLTKELEMTVISQVSKSTGMLSFVGIRKFKAGRKTKKD